MSRRLSVASVAKSLYSAESLVRAAEALAGSVSVRVVEKGEFLGVSLRAKGAASERAFAEAVGEFFNEALSAHYRAAVSALNRPALAPVLARGIEDGLIEAGRDFVAEMEPQAAADRARERAELLGEARRLARRGRRDGPHPSPLPLRGRGGIRRMKGRTKGR